MDSLTALRRTYEQTEAVIDAVPADAWHRATPCSEWDVQALVNHVVAVLSGFPVVLAGGKAVWTASALGPDPLADFRRAADGNLEAWAVPGAAARPSPKLPGIRLIDVNLLDTLTHTWDLATATGQSAVLDDAVVSHVYARWRGGALETARRSGTFGPEIPVLPDAPSLDRLIGLTGRTPGGPVRSVSIAAAQ